MFMRIVKILMVVVFLICLVAYIGVKIFMRGGMPQYSGGINVDGGALDSDVKIIRDRHGVPHIVGETEKDVYFALGYIHAQERLFQMVMTRRVVQGRLSELVGDAKLGGGFGHPTILAQDRFNRIIGFEEMAEIGGKLVSPKTSVLLESYSAGVNEYIENAEKLPPEFTLLGLEPEPWKPADTIAFGRYIGWGLSSNWKRELYRLAAIGELGLERGWELLPRYPDHGPYIIEPDIKKYDPRGKIIRKHPLPVSPETLKWPVIKALLNVDIPIEGLPILRGSDVASNSWAVSGEHSESGAPILANDPHLVHTLPSVFFQAHLKTNDGILDAIGVTFPGIPCMMLGHNRNVAWAATTTRADTQDLFIERVNPENPGQYFYMNKWHDFEEREEVIRIKTDTGFREEKLTVRSTVHGPVLNDILGDLVDNAPPIALKWAGQYASQDIDGFVAMARSKNATDYKKAISHIGVPVQNWVYADKEGNIGYFASGYYPLRNRSDGTLPVPGWSGAYDWRGFVPYQELPQLENPSNGIIITANNAVLPEKDYSFTVSFNYKYYRALRLKELLASKEKFTMQDMADFQMDHYTKQGERLTPVFLEAFEKAGDKNDKIAARAAEQLADWDFLAAPGSAGSAVFHTAYAEAVKLMYGDDVSETLLKFMLDESGIEAALDRTFETGQSTFFDRIDTEEKETRDDILAGALSAAAHILSDRFGNNPGKWRWGKLHYLRLSHPFSSRKPLEIVFPANILEGYGARTTVFAAFHSYADNDFSVTGGPAFRHVVDMSDVPGARMVLDTGQSGHPVSKHYFDQNKLWYSGDTIPMLMDIDEVEKQNDGILNMYAVQ